MPIKPELRKKYYGKVWVNSVRPRILKRAGGLFDSQGKYLGEARCEHCNAMDRQTYLDKRGFTRWVQIGIAHLDMRPQNNIPANLAALCRACHLAHDRQFHLANAKSTRCTRKDRARPLLREASA